MLDVSFPLKGKTLPRDHAEDLLAALCVHFSWLRSDPGTGIHAIKLVQGLDEPALLSQRTRLTLRVMAERAEELQALGDFALDIAGHSLQLGSAQARELLPHGTLYAYKVAADSVDEVAFMAGIANELAALDTTGVHICGKRQQMQIAGQTQQTFSLMLHGLSPAQSLRVQAHGLGPHRLLGCGLFVPHRSATAVGS
jgi:CRISPR-associated protein Cas6